MAVVQTIFAGDVAAGTRIPEVVHRPSHVQLFRFSAVTWNAHRIHYDQAYAAQEGYPDVLVQSHLHGCFLVRTLLDWAGPLARLTGFRWQNRRYAVPGDELRCSGVVTAVEGPVIHCELSEVNERGELCAPAWATLRLPTREEQR